MAALRPAPQPSPVWGSRLTQWGVVVLLVIALGGTMAYQLRAVRGQAELAQIKSTLGALRTALVVAHLQAAVAGTPGSAQIVVPAQRNPFAALQQLPANYAGMADPQALAAMPGGSWVFDPACSCIGYGPMETDRLEAPRGAVALWFRVVGSGGVLQLSAQQPYVWMGQRVD